MVKNHSLTFAGCRVLKLRPRGVRNNYGVVNITRADDDEQSILPRNVVNQACPWAHRSCKTLIGVAERQVQDPNTWRRWLVSPLTFLHPNDCAPDEVDDQL